MVSVRNGRWAALSRALGRGVVSDVRRRAAWYRDDWTSIAGNPWRVAAASTFIFFASVMPALAFGIQFQSDTDDAINVVHVLAACAATGTLQSVAGGQPLLVVGVAEPIVLVYTYMYDFAKDKQGLGPSLFLAWSAWVCVFTSAFLLVLSLTNACVYIKRFTRYAGEAFGALIALLFLQQAIKGLVKEFDVSTDNGLWSLFLACGMLTSSMIVRTARAWRFGFGWARGLLADYGVPLLVVAWTGVSYASACNRVDTPNTWDVTDSWQVASRMGQVPGRFVGAAVVPAIIVTVLFFFDHNVSSQLAQQPEFNLKKGPAYHWDMLLLSLMTLLCGLIGLPPVNGVIPQSPMLTKSLALVDAGRGGEGGEGGVGIGNGDNISCHKSPAEDEQGGPKTAPELVPIRVVETRGANLFQSLLLGACLGITPAIRWIPTSLLWSYFAFMAFESLPGSQLWERLLLLLTDPRRRYRVFEKPHAAFLETVPFRVIAAFTAIQAAIVGGIYGLTWAGLAGILFPVPIMLLVPFRQWVLPRLFSAGHLSELDKTAEEEVAGLDHRAAVRAAHDNEAEEAGAAEEEEDEPEDIEMHRFRVVHRVTRQGI